MPASSNIAVVGTGVLGRQLIRAFEDWDTINTVLIVELADHYSSLDAFGADLVYHLRYDTIYGRWDKYVSFYSGDDYITISGNKIYLQLIGDYSNMDLAYHGVDVAIECFGKSDDGSFYNGVRNSGGKVALTTTVPTPSGFSLYGRAVVTAVNDPNHGYSAYMADGALIAKACVDNVMNNAFSITDIQHTILISATNFGYVQDYPDGTASYSGRGSNNIAYAGNANDADSRLGYVIPSLQGKSNTDVYRVNTENVNTIRYEFKSNNSLSTSSVALALKAGQSNSSYEYMDDDIVSSDYAAINKAFKNKMGIAINKIFVPTYDSTRCFITAYYENILLQVDNICYYLDNHADDWSIS